VVVVAVAAAAAAAVAAPVTVAVAVVVVVIIFIFFALFNNKYKIKNGKKNGGDGNFKTLLKRGDAANRKGGSGRLPLTSMRQDPVPGSERYCVSPFNGFRKYCRSPFNGSVK